MDFVRYAEELVRGRDRRSAGLVVVEQVESTITLGRRLIEEYTREGALPPNADLVAWEQVRGRGRQGRSWSSAPGSGIFATLIRGRLGRDSLQHLPLRIGVALCDAVNRHLEGRCCLKWPNDLLVGERKLGGLLIEVVTRERDRPRAAVSFGVNYGDDLSLRGQERATSILREASKPLAMAALALELLRAVDDELDHGDVDTVVDRYVERTLHRPGDPMVCRIDGAKDLRGHFLGFDERGFLRLDVDGQERVVASGEICNPGRFAIDP